MSMLTKNEVSKHIYLDTVVLDNKNKTKRKRKQRGWSLDTMLNELFVFVHIDLPVSYFLF